MTHKPEESIDNTSATTGQSESETVMVGLTSTPLDHPSVNLSGDGRRGQIHAIGKGSARDSAPGMFETRTDAALTLGPLLLLGAVLWAGIIALVCAVLR